MLGWGLLIIVASTVIGSLTRRPPELETSLVNVYGASIVSFALLGALIAARRPGNHFGWLLSAIAFIHACGYLLQAIAGYLLVSRPRSAAGRVLRRLALRLDRDAALRAVDDVRFPPLPRRSSALSTMAAGGFADARRDRYLATWPTGREP